MLGTYCVNLASCDNGMIKSSTPIFTVHTTHLKTQQKLSHISEAHVAFLCCYTAVIIKLGTTHNCNIQPILTCLIYKFYTV